MLMLKPRYYAESRMPGSQEALKAKPLSCVPGVISAGGVVKEGLMADFGAGTGSGAAESQ